MVVCYLQGPRFESQWVQRISKAIGPRDFSIELSKMYSWETFCRGLYFRTPAHKNFLLPIKKNPHVIVLKFVVISKLHEFILLFFYAQYMFYEVHKYDCVWQLGFSILSNISLLMQSLLAALGSIQFVSNIAFAYFVLNKMVTVKYVKIWSEDLLSEWALSTLRYYAI